MAAVQQCRRSVRVIRAINLFHKYHFCQQAFSQKIIKILQENEQNVPHRNNSENDIQQTSKSEHELSEYEEHMEQFMRINTENSLVDGMKLFQKIKSMETTTDLDSLYYPAIKLILHSSSNSNGKPSKKAFNKMVAINEEIRSKNKNQQAMIKCDGIVIETALSVKQNKIAQNVFESVFKNKEMDQYFENLDFCQKVSRLYGQTDRCLEGIKFLRDIEEKYGMLPNNAMICELLRGIAFEISKQNKFLYLRSVESLFEQSFGERNVDKYPNVFVFESVLSIYSKIGEVETCKKIIDHLLDNDGVDRPNVICFNLAMKAALRSNDKESEEFIEEMLRKMEEMDVAKNSFIYETLFSLCGHGEHRSPDFDALSRYYQEAIDSDVTLSTIALRSWAMTGLDYFESANMSVDELMTFKNFAIAECKRMYGDKCRELIQEVEARTAGIKLF